MELAEDVKQGDKESFTGGFVSCTRASKGPMIQFG